MLPLVQKQKIPLASSNGSNDEQLRRRARNESQWQHDFPVDRVLHEHDVFAFVFEWLGAREGARDDVIMAQYWLGNQK